MFRYVRDSATPGVGHAPEVGTVQISYQKFVDNMTCHDTYCQERMLPEIEGVSQHTKTRI